MRIRRRRRGSDVVAGASLPAVTSERLEKLLFAVVVHAQQIEDRIGRLEQRLDDVGVESLDWVTHGDLLDVQLRHAKLAGELARLNIELRGEISAAFDRARDPDHGKTSKQVRMEALAEAIIDLDDRLYEAPVIHLDGHESRRAG